MAAGQSVGISLLIALLGACVASSEPIRIDGSSTLYPVLQIVTDELLEVRPEAAISIGSTGTGGGFELFCSGGADLIGTSRPIGPDELTACAEAAVEFIELPVAYDSITLVVNEGNDWADCLTSEEFGRMWGARSPAKRWSDIRPGWPHAEIAFHAPGVASGTHDLVAGVLRELTGASADTGPDAATGEVDRERGTGLRTDFYPSEDDSVLVEAVLADVDATAFFGYAYFHGERDRLREVPVDFGFGCTRIDRPGPLPASPLARTLYVYAAAESLTESAVATEFLELLLAPSGQRLVERVGYWPLEEEVRRAVNERLTARLTGVSPAPIAVPLRTPTAP